MNRGAHVIAAQSMRGGEIVASHAFFGRDAIEARARYEEHLARRRGTTRSSARDFTTPELAGVKDGQRTREAGHPAGAGLAFSRASTLGAPARKVWTLQPPDGSDYAFVEGERYAVVASVSKNYARSEIEKYLADHGWLVTYSWEQGQPSRGLGYAIDDWLASLPADTTSNHRWLYAEANRTGQATTLGQDPPWPLTIYHVAHVFRAVDAPPDAPSQAPSLPSAQSTSSAPIPSRVPAFLSGVVLGALGVVLWRVVARSM